MPLFRRCFEEAQIPLSDYSFANNVVWQSHRRLLYTVVEGCVCLLSLRGGVLSMWLPPLGPDDRAVEAMDACIALMIEHNAPTAGFEIACVHEGLLEAFYGATAWRDAYAVIANPPDYLYSTSELIELRGNAYKSKRNDINQLLRAHADVRLDALGPEHQGEVAELCELWLAQRRIDEGSLDELALEESHAILYAVDHMDALGLTGLRLLVDGRTEAFILGERLLPDVGHVLFEKSNRDRRGAAQLIFREYCRTLGGCARINTGDALGSDGLARNKESYRPLALGRKFTICSR
ncbi:MAG: phosphatidylglycerol lysyltransferase domain-containing protein [Nannocystaceae bacterium]